MQGRCEMHLPKGRASWVQQPEAGAAVMETLGTRLRALRKQKKWTLRYVAERIGTDESTICRIELDRIMPLLGKILALAHLYRVTSEYLLWGDGVPTSAAPHETCGERIRRLRIARGLTQKQLAERLGSAHYLTVGQWEHERCIPSSELLPALGRALGVTTDYLLTGRESAIFAAIKSQIRQHAPYDRLLAMVSVYD